MQTTANATRSIAFVAPYNNRALRTVKVSSLYFDRIELRPVYQYDVEIEKGAPIISHPNGGYTRPARIKNRHEFLPDSFRHSIRPIIQAGIGSICGAPSHALSRQVSQWLGELVDDRRDLLFTMTTPVNGSASLRTVDLDLPAIIGRGQEYLRVGDTVDFTGAITAYGQMLEIIANDLSLGTSVITSNVSLQEYLRLAFERGLLELKDSQTLKSRLAEGAIVQPLLDAALMDVGDLEFDDILMVREKLAEEREQLREHLDTLQYDIASATSARELIVGSRELVQAKILPSFRELEVAAGKLTGSAFRHFLQAVLDKDKYVAVGASAYAGAPPELLLAASVGTVALDTLLRFYEELNAVRQNGLFYLLKARDELRPLSRRQRRRR